MTCVLHGRPRTVWIASQLWHQDGRSRDTERENGHDRDAPGAQTGRRDGRVRHTARRECPDPFGASCRADVPRVFEVGGKCVADTGAMQACPAPHIMQCPQAAQRMQAAPSRAAADAFNNTARLAQQMALVHGDLGKTGASHAGWSSSVGWCEQWHARVSRFSWHGGTDPDVLRDMCVGQIAAEWKAFVRGANQTAELWAGRRAVNVTPPGSAHDRQMDGPLAATTTTSVGTSCTTSATPPALNRETIRIHNSSCPSGSRLTGSLPCAGGAHPGMLVRCLALTCRPSIRARVASRLAILLLLLARRAGSTLPPDHLALRPTPCRCALAMR
ncbi:hypothetical protein BST61_g10744 [Cercospora zeina]